jgi:hypothetical protein
MHQQALTTRKLSWGEAGYSEAPGSPKKSGGFIKGPLPLPWLQTTMQLPGKTLHLALAIWYLAGLNRRTDNLMLSPKVVRSFGLSRDAQYDGLHRLEAQGLILVSRQPGQAPRVTLTRLEGPHD